MLTQVRFRPRSALSALCRAIASTRRPRPVHSRGDLDAAAFAFVMATGIVSVAAFQQGTIVLSDALLAIACLSWVILAAAVARHARAVQRRRPRLQSFALVAATAVIGARFAVGGAGTLALVLWSASCGFWLLLILQRPRGERIRGGSLLIIVATESLSVLAALLAPRWIGTPLLEFAFAAWLLGLVLYPLVAGRLAVAHSHRRWFEADLWIVMGALAITTLAGSQLVLAMRTMRAFTGLEAGLADADLATWVVAAALIIPLAVVDLQTRSRWRYEAERWGFVFPLGMFSVASQILAHTDKLSLLGGIARTFFVIALVAWTFVALAGLRRAGIGATRWGASRR